MYTLKFWISKRMIKSLFPVIVILSLLWLLEFNGSNHPKVMKTHTTVRHIALTELSGIIQTKKSGEYWGINDKGNRPLLFRFTQNGKPLQTVSSRSLTNNDWEAITSDHQGTLYIGDIGDNNRTRKQYSIFTFMEPSESSKKITSVKRIDFQYPKNKSYNSEAMFFYNDNLYVITKEKDKRDSPKLFQLTVSGGQTKVKVSEVGELKIKDRVSDAAISANGNHLAVLADNTLYISFIQSEKDLSQKPEFSFQIEYGNCEGICFDGDKLVISNENGNLWFHDINDLIK